MRTKKYIIERSNYPDERGTHILFLHSSTQHGENYQGVFKGTYKECVAKKILFEKRVKKNISSKPKVKKVKFIKLGGTK